MSGGQGSDTANYATAFFLQGVVADLVNPSVNTGDAAGDTYDSIENILGSFYGDVLRGDSNANWIGGGLNGDDALSGRGGADTLTGRSGADSIAGGLGADQMTGGDGADRFIYTATNETGNTKLTSDVITDFEHLIDRIGLFAIDAVPGGKDNAFTFIHDSPFTAPGQLRAVQVGADTVLMLNTVGASGAEAQIILSDFTASTLVAHDFVL